MKMYISQQFLVFGVLCEHRLVELVLQLEALLTHRFQAFQRALSLLGHVLLERLLAHLLAILVVLLRIAQIGYLNLRETHLQGLRVLDHLLVDHLHAIVVEIRLAGVGLVTFDLFLQLLFLGCSRH
jgi:hypothetical protein